jgi:HEAT repeat protein
MPDPAAPSSAVLAAEVQLEALDDDVEGFPLMEVNSPADVRLVLRYTQNATLEQAAELRRAALESKDPLVAGNALLALGRLRAVAGDDELTALLDDPRQRVRQDAVKALGLSGDQAQVATLAPLLSTADASLRPLVIQALGQLGGERATALLTAIRDDPAEAERDRVFARVALSGARSSNATPFALRTRERVRTGE